MTARKYTIIESVTKTATGEVLKVRKYRGTLAELKERDRLKDVWEWGLFYWDGGSCAKRNGNKEVKTNPRSIGTFVETLNNSVWNRNQFYSRFPETSIFSIKEEGK